MIHYHGLPITPDTAAAAAISGGHAFVSFAHPGQLTLAMDCAQSFALDNGAFSAWRNGTPITDWEPYYAWVDRLRHHPAFDFAVIPDVIDGDEDAQDALIEEWPFGPTIGVPVWHMHEPVERLVGLCDEFPRVALGSSGEWSVVGNADWWARMAEAMDAVCVQGSPPAKLHGLRMLNIKVFTRLPLASADSCNIGRNVGIDQAWKGTYLPPNKSARAQILRQRIESHQSAPIWNPAIL